VGRPLGDASAEAAHIDLQGWLGLDGCGGEERKAAAVASSSSSCPLKEDSEDSNPKVPAGTEGGFEPASPRGLHRIAAEAVEADAAGDLPRALGAYRRALERARQLSTVHTNSGSLREAMSSYAKRADEIQAKMEEKALREGAASLSPSFSAAARDEALGESRRWAAAAVEADAANRVDDAVSAYRSAVRDLAKALAWMDAELPARDGAESRLSDYQKRLGQLEETQGRGRGGGKSQPIDRGREEEPTSTGGTVQ